MNFFLKLLQLASQPSTWKGIALIFGGGMSAVSPDSILQIGAGVAASIGLIDVFRNEDNEKASNEH